MATSARWRVCAAALVIACLVACGAASPAASPVGPPPGPSSESDTHDAAWVTRRCTEQYEQFEANWATYMPREKATSDFRRCPKWRMAGAGACGAPIQPSFMDPCKCMCDLCEHDAECTRGSGGACVEMSSVLSGGYPERVCVYETEICHPTKVRTCTKHCVTLFGHTECIR